MMTTLKENYKTRKMIKKINYVDSQLISENNASRLIMEAMDEDTLQKATSVIDKLNKLKDVTKDSQAIQSAINDAIKSVNKYTGGGSIASLFNKIGEKITGSNPLIKSLVLIQCFESGYKMLPNIVKNTGVDLSSAQDSDSITSVIQGSETQVKTQEGSEKLALCKKNLLKAFTPSGIFGAFKKMPFGDAEQVVNEILLMSLQNIKQQIAVMKSGTTVEEVGKDIAQAVKNDPEATGINASTPTTGTSQTKSTTSSQALSNKEAKRITMKDLTTNVSNKTKVSEDDVEKVISALHSDGYIKSA